MAEKLSLYGFSTGVGVGAGEAVTSGEAASEGEPCSGGVTSEESVPEEVVLSVSWLSLVPEGVTELSLVASIAAAELCHLLVFSFVYTDEIIRLVILGRYMIQGKWIKPVTSQGKAALEEFFG